jgi:rubredoxin
MQNPVKLSFKDRLSVTPETLISWMTVMRKWQCAVCGFIYEEEKGLPDEGISPGTSWDDIPDSWQCPECGVTKAEFEMVELDDN